MPHINKTPKKNPDLKIMNTNSYQTTNVKIIKKINKSHTTKSTRKNLYEK